MTVFKAFLKILRKNLAIVFVYVIILLIFGGLSIKSEDKSMSFENVKPDILIINNDREEGITKGLIDYIKENSTTPDIENDKYKINDALFYRDIDYVIYIPKDFNKDFINGNIDKIEIKSNNNYNSEYAQMLLDRYLNIANIYKNISTNEEVLISNIKNNLTNDAEVTLLSNLDSDSLSTVAFYFNFESYSLLVGLIFVICLMLSVFNEEKIRKRNIISSSNYKKNNRILLFANLLYALVLWILYTILAFIILGDMAFTKHGILMMINSFIFVLPATALAFLLGTLVTDKNALSGITNVVALGSSFLCGAFVPQEMLNDTVLMIGHFIPTYYYINSNDLIAKIEVFNLDTLRPIIINSIIMLLFMLVFIIMTNIVSKKRQKI